MQLKFLLVVLAVGSISWANEAEDLVKASDRARGGVKDGVTWKVRLQSWENGKESDRTFMVKAKGNDALVEALEPAQNKGETYLFNDRTIWFFKPSLKKPVSISARQKLSGQAANGDIASTNYARDYTPTIEKTEKIGNQNTKVLLLKAKSDQVTYDQIRYWVDEKSKLALKAEFMTLQGAPFKTAIFEYKNTIRVDGAKIASVSKLTLTDAKNPENKSVMIYTNPSASKHPAAIFNINNLSR